MRRKDREIKEFDGIIDVLSRCKVLHLALISEGKPYAVPVNFGFAIHEDKGQKKLVIYIHGAGEGKKLDAIRVNQRLCQAILYNRAVLAKLSQSVSPLETAN